MEVCKEKETFLNRIIGVFKEVNNEDNLNKNTKSVVLVGSPNVGKSVIFNSLTGAYVTVSNYPGTTVEVSKGWYKTKDVNFEIIDTPGIYSIMPITEEERVTRRMLMSSKPDLVIHVVDAKNIARMLPLTFQLIESGFCVVLVLNIMDEANTLGINIDSRKLRECLGIPVIKASATLNKGLDEIKSFIENNTKGVRTNCCIAYSSR